MGLTGKFIGSIERGENFASFTKLEDIAKALSCDIFRFFEFDYSSISEHEVSLLIQQRVKNLSGEEKRFVLKIIDWLSG